MVVLFVEDKPENHLNDGKCDPVSGKTRHPLAKMVIHCTYTPCRYSWLTNTPLILVPVAVPVYSVHTIYRKHTCNLTCEAIYNDTTRVQIHVIIKLTRKDYLVVCGDQSSQWAFTLVTVIWM